MALERLSYLSDEPKIDTPLLFVHGAWHGAWCWEAFFLPYFKAQGYKSYALSLRGHGNSPATKPMIFNGIWDYVADVAETAAQIESEEGQRPVVIGHSMGGYITQKYLEKYAAPAAVLLASIPSVGTLPLNLRWLWHEPLSMLMCTLTLSAYPLVNTPTKVKRHFFSDDMPDAQVKEYFPKLQNESLRILLDGGLLNKPQPRKVSGVPILVIAAENDRVFTVDEEKKTAQDYGTEAVIFPDMAHDVMLEADWQNVADHIIGWLDGLALS